MALNAKNVGGGNGPRIAQANLEAGNYPVRLVQVIDYGVQPQRPYMGQDKPPAQEIGLTYEFLDEFLKDEDGNDMLDKPRWLSETMPLHNLKADRARSTQRYLAFDPQIGCGGDFSKLVGMPAMLTVINNPGKDGKVYDNVGSVNPMRPKDARTAPELVNQGGYFDLDAPDMRLFGKFPKWIQEKIQGNLGFQGSALQKALKGEVASPKEAPKKVVEEAAVEDDSNNPY